MSYATFPYKPCLRAGDLADPAQMNAAFDGIQAEFEDRSAAAWLDGVVAGMECSINGAAVDIASGSAYVAGMLFTGGASVGFDESDPAGTYYIYVSSADRASPYRKSLTQPGPGNVVLCSVQWDGSGLSNLADLRPWGLLPTAIRFSVPGAVAAGTIGYAVLDRDMWIEDVEILLANTGSSGSTVVDVHVGNAGSEPATIFSDQSLRPRLASGAPGYSTAQSGAPDTNRRAAAGQVLRVDVDEAADGATGLAVTIRCRL
ncbi:MAG: hypothetical protein H5T86_14430 [Armatimonadetes bacterium]|nr:hypothetical protein [Armatimonadota bacterium]